MKQRNFRLFIFHLSLILIVPVVTSAAVLEEIVVTAQKREQNLQDVSVTVTAFTGDTIEELGLQDPRDIANLMPNVSVQSKENFPSFNIRGIQLLDFSDSNESPVSFYIDEVYYGTPAGQVGELFDIERAEVLRGPQGTLYGRNSTGGLVHFITRKPTEEFEARGSFEYASDDEIIGQLSVSGSLSDSVRGRIAGKVHQRDGWQTGGLGQELASVDTWSLRGMLEMEVSDSMTALVTVNGTTINNAVEAVTSVGLNNPNIPVPLFPGPGAPTIFPVPCFDQAAVLRGECVNFFGVPSSTDPERSQTEANLSNDTNLWGANLKLVWGISDVMQVTSITAYNSIDKDVVSDADGSIAPIGHTEYFVDSESFSQEIRLTGNTEKLDWIAGAFYYDDDKDRLDFSVPVVVALFGGGFPYSFNSEATLETKSWALFGQAEYSLTDTITFIGGIRYTDEKKDLLISDDLENPGIAIDQTTFMPIFDPDTGAPVIFLINEKIDETEVTGRVGLDWRPNDDVLAFFSFSTGYKSGAFNTAFARLDNVLPSASETVMNYEVGLKTTIWDDRLRFNASAFYSDYSDLQSAIVEPGTISGAIVNVGDADIYGLEVEATWIVNEDIEVLFALGLLDGEVESTNSFNDNELPYTPSVSTNGLVRYRLPFKVLGGDVTWTNAVKFVSEHYQTVQNEFTSIQDDYVVWDTVLRWGSQDSRFYIEGFIKNANDEKYTVDRYTVDGLGWAATSWARLRHGGVRVGFNFN